MRTRQLAVLLVAALAGSALAGDAEERLRAAVAKMADEDPAVRAEGRELLGVLAEERPDLVGPVAQHADAEVAATAREVIFERCLLKDDVDNGRFDVLLARIADPRREPAARRALFKRFLDLGPKAAEHLASELKESTTKSLLEPVTLLPGQQREINLRVRNAGARALWYLPEQYTVSQAVPEPFGGYGPGRGRIVARGGGSSESAADMVLSALSHLRRVPPEGEIELGKVLVDARRCALFRIRVHAASASGVKATFSGVELPASPQRLSELPGIAIPVLAPRVSTAFESQLLPKGPGGRPAIKVTATRDIEPALPDGQDRFWWVALDGEGRYLDSGPMRDALPVTESWKASESTTVEMPCDLPAGTRKLWLGMDVDNDGSHAVPPPLEIPQPDSKEK